MPTKKTNEKDPSAEQDKNLVAFSYAWILCLVPLLGKKKSKFAQFHAKQGLILFVLSIFTVVPFFGQLLMLVLAVVSVMGIVKTLNGEWWEIPLIYDWSKKINL